MAAQQETILVELTDKERAERAFELAGASKQVLELEADRTAYVREKNAKIKELKKRIRELADAYDTGKERRPAQMKLTGTDNADVVPFN